MTRINIRHMLKKKLASGTAYYFNPTRPMKEAGLVPQALGRDLSAAIEAAERLNRTWDELRNAQPSGPVPGTMSWLIREHRRSDRYKVRTSASNEEVDRVCDIIEARFGRYQVAAIERKHVSKFYEDERGKGSLHRANTIHKWFRYILFQAINRGLIKENPAAKMEIVATPPRDEIWTDAEIAAVEGAAHDMGRSSVALAIRLAVDLGQRQGDVLRLPWSAYDGTHITLRQSKTKHLVRVGILPELKSQLDALILTKKSPLMVTSEHTGRPYKKLQFNRLFREALTKVPSAKTKQYRDLRRSAAVRLTEAGCTPQEVAAICGWSIAYTTRMLDVYVPRTTTMADNAVAKLGEARRRTKSE